MVSWGVGRMKQDQDIREGIYLIIILVVMVISGFVGYGMALQKYKYMSNETILNQSEQLTYIKLGYTTALNEFNNKVISDLSTYQEFRFNAFYNNQTIPIRCEVMK